MRQNKSIRLGVNVDHIATLRQQRLGKFPDPVAFALKAQDAGAHSIVAHLREDRRHIQDDDIKRLKKALSIPLNLEMSIAADVVAIALKVVPQQVTLVPERRQELTTEGGLDVVKQFTKLQPLVEQFHKKGIDVSLFIDADEAQWQATKKLGASTIEFHTGGYADALSKRTQQQQLKAMQKSSTAASQAGLIVAAGHGLDVHNVDAIASIPEIEELNIGYSIVMQSLSVGFNAAVKDMLRAMKRTRRIARQSV